MKRKVIKNSSKDCRDSSNKSKRDSSRSEDKNRFGKNRNISKIEVIFNSTLGSPLI